MNQDNNTNTIKKILFIITHFILISIILILIFNHNNSDCKDLNQRIESIEQQILNNNCLDCDKTI